MRQAAAPILELSSSEHISDRPCSQASRSLAIY